MPPDLLPHRNGEVRIDALIGAEPAIAAGNPQLRQLVRLLYRQTAHLHRMEQNGWVRASWAVTEYSRKAKFYALTAAGKKQLAEREKNWQDVAKGVEAILRFA